MNNNFSCEDCNKFFSGIVPYQQHLSSLLHKKKIESKELCKQIGKEDQLDQSSFFQCKLCDKRLSGPVPYQQHMESLQHTKKLKQKELIDKLHNNSGDTSSNIHSSSGDTPYTIKTNLGDTPFTIKTNSGDTASILEDLNELKIVVNREAMLACKICNEDFQTQLDFGQHAMSVEHASNILLQDIFKNFNLKGDPTWLRVPDDNILIYLKNNN